MSPEDSLQLLSRACARHVPVDLHRADDDGLLVARARLVRVEGEEVLLNALLAAGGDIRIAEGAALVAYFVLGDNRYTFSTRIKRAHCRVRLNERRVVDGLAIARPRQLSRGQRRQHYRVSVAGIGGLAARVHFTGRECPDVVPIDARRFDDAIVDISGGGLGLRVKHATWEQFSTGDLLFVTFRIPEEPYDLVFLCEMRHARPILDGTAARLGVAFVNWPDAAHRRRQSELIERYSAKLQREALRRAS